MQTSLILTRTHLDEMIRHVSAQLPLEACGLLAGRGARAESVLTVTNAAQSPARFRMDPLEQLHAFEWIESRGLDLVGIFHSHPAGPATVSPADIAEATYEVVHIVLSRSAASWQARGFWIEGGQAVEIPLRVE
jgi:proteasome lid subunit RPN8/RPN11